MSVKWLTARIQGNARDLKAPTHVDLVTDVPIGGPEAGILYNGNFYNEATDDGRFSTSLTHAFVVIKIVNNFYYQLTVISSDKEKAKQAFEEEEAQYKYMMKCVIRWDAAPLHSHDRVSNA